MSIGSINRKDLELNNAISGILKVLQKTIRDPFFKVITFDKFKLYTF